MIRFIIVAGAFSCLGFTLNAQTMEPRQKIQYLPGNFQIEEIDHRAWKKAEETVIGKYWSGKKAPAERQFKARLLWSEKALYIRFEANQSEPLIISDAPNLKTKTRGLWDRDVCEVFIAPNRRDPRKYFEFEIAPNGEWIDLAIDFTGKERQTAWDYNSGMRSAVMIGKDKIVMAIKIEWKAFGRAPKEGDVWLGNLFRCVGKDPDRGYLAWQPTMTDMPNFHVPEKFGEFVFEK